MKEADFSEKLRIYQDSLPHDAAVYTWQPGDILHLHNYNVHCVGIQVVHITDTMATPGDWRQGICWFIFFGGGVGEWRKHAKEWKCA